MKNRSWICCLLVALALMSWPAAAQSSGSNQRTIHVPDGWQGAYQFGYAPAVQVGDRLILSGIPAGGEGSYEDKIRRMYQRAKELLEAAGASIEDVIELTSYHLQPRTSAEFTEEFRKYMPIHQEFFGEHRPAWTAVGTTALLSPSAVVEVRFEAVIGSGKNSRVARGR